MIIDRKFHIVAVNPVNLKLYDENNSLLLCAKDAAVPAALNAYLDECVRIGANPEHIESIALLLERVLNFQIAAGGGRVPDTVGEEIPRCLNGDQVGNPKTTETNLLRLIRQHNLHWEAVAEALGGISCGGVDIPVSDPLSTAGAIITEIKRLQEESAVKVKCATHGSRTFGLCSACVNAEEARKSPEVGREVDDLMAVFDAALNAHPHLFIEIGYTRVTDWMVHIWDAHGTSIANAPKIICTQSPSRSEACREATEQLKLLTV